MVKIIEASAVISGRAGDLSGFEAVANKLNAVSKAGANVKTALGGAAGDLGKRVSEISAQLAKIDNFKAASRGLDQASIAMRRAQQEAGRLKQAMAEAASPNRSMQSDYDRAAKAVERASQAFRQQGQAVRDARSALSEAGIPVNQIARQQAQLTQALNTTTQAMQRQASAGKALAQPWGAPARSGSGVPLISRVAPGGVVPPGVPVIPAGGSAAPAARQPLPVGEVAGGLGLIEAGRRAVLAGADIDTERSQARQAGWSEAEIARAERAANDYAGRYGIAPGAAMNIIREGRPTFGGSLDQTLENVAPFFDVLTAMRQKSPQASAEEHNRQLGSMIKAGEILGYSSDPAKLKSYADFMTQMVQVHGSALRGEEVLNFAKSGKSAASGVSFDYLKSIFPTMLPELGGDRLGTASMTLRQALVGGKMKKRAAENLAELGLIDPAGMIKTADDDVMGVKASAVKGAKLIEQNPLEWVRQVLVPAMDAKQVKPEDRPAMLSTLFSDRNAEYLINLLVTQMSRLEKDRATVEKAKGVAGAQEALRDDPYLAAKRVAGGAANVGSALAAPFIGPLKAAADAAAGALTTVADAARATPTAAATGTAAGGLAGGLAGWLGMGGSGLLWRGAAAAGGAAGGGLASGALLPLMISKFIESLAAHGPEAALPAQDFKSASPGWQGDYERSWQAQKERMRDPEAARGRAMMGLGDPGRGIAPQQQIEAVVRPDQITAKADVAVSGQAAVSVNLIPTAAFAALIQAAQAIVNMPLKGGSGPGSTGGGMPEAAAPTGGASSP